MGLKSNRNLIAGSLLIFLSLLSFNSYGQQTPLNPVSYWIFVPYIYNPASVGSKDYATIGFNASFQGESNTQLLSGDTRLTKTTPGYFSSPEITEFTNIGLGGSLYRDVDGLSKNAGASFSFSYHIPLNAHRLSFLSFGTSVKGSYSTISSNTEGLSNPQREKIYPNFDLGMYYYGTSAFAGISAVNLLGSPWIPDPQGNYDVPVSRQYFFTGGFKILLSRKFNIVLEPSVLVSATDSTFGKTGDNINPIIKLYLENFCLGSSYNSSNDGTTSVFVQFRYPSFYIGAYYEFVNNTAYYKSKPVVEIAFGLSIHAHRAGYSKHGHW